MKEAIVVINEDWCGPMSPNSTLDPRGSHCCRTYIFCLLVSQTFPLCLASTLSVCIGDGRQTFYLLY